MPDAKNPSKPDFLNLDDNRRRIYLQSKRFCSTYRTTPDLKHAWLDAYIIDRPRILTAHHNFLLKM